MAACSSATALTICACALFDRLPGALMVFAGEAGAEGSVVLIQAKRPPSDIALALELAAALASGADNAIAEWTIDITPGD